MNQKMSIDDKRITSQRHLPTNPPMKRRTETESVKSVTKRLTASEMKSQETENDMNGLGKSKDYQRYKRMSNVCLMLLGIKVILCFVYYELDHMENVNTDWLLFCAFSLHCYLVMLRLVTEKIRYQRMQVIQKLCYSYHWQLFKIMVSLPLYPFPWLQNITFDVSYNISSGQDATYPFKVNYLILIPAIVDSMIVIIHMIILETSYYSPRAQRVGKIYQVQQYGDLYAIKCIVKDRPITAFAILTGMMLFLSAFSLRVFQGDVPINGNNFVYYESCFWFICITITTVGYGDIHPVSNLGHVMVCFCCVWSCFNTSVVTFMMISNFSLSQSEQKSLQLLRNVDNTLQRKKISKEYIRIAIYRLWLNKKYQFKYPQSLQQKKLRVSLFQLRIDRKKSLDRYDLAEEMKREFDIAQINVGILTENTKNLMDYIANQYFVNSKVVILKPSMKTNSKFFKRNYDSEDQSEISNISIHQYIRKITRKIEETIKKDEKKLKDNILKSGKQTGRHPRFASIHA